MNTILFELGCEELPPKSLKTLQNATFNAIDIKLLQLRLVGSLAGYKAHLIRSCRGL